MISIKIYCHDFPQYAKLRKKILLCVEDLGISGKILFQHIKNADMYDCADSSQPTRFSFPELIEINSADYHLPAILSWFEKNEVFVPVYIVNFDLFIESKSIINRTWETQLRDYLLHKTAITRLIGAFTINNLRHFLTKSTKHNLSEEEIATILTKVDELGSRRVLTTDQLLIPDFYKYLDQFRTELRKDLIHLLFLMNIC